MDSWGYTTRLSPQTTAKPLSNTQAVKHTEELIRVFYLCDMTFKWQTFVSYEDSDMERYRAVLMFNQSGCFDTTVITSYGHPTETEAEEETAVWALRRLQMAGNEKAAKFLAAQQCVA